MQNAPRGAFCNTLTFIKLPFVIKIFVFLSIFEWLFYTDLLYLSVSVGLRTGDAPDVAAIVQEKFDMELEMAKTLIQQECEETIESEQVRGSFPLCICFIRPCHTTMF